jgi:hypothetical protein
MDRRTIGSVRRGRLRPNAVAEDHIELPPQAILADR